MSVPIPTPTEFIKIARATARHFGFEPIEDLIERVEKSGVKKLRVKKIPATERKIDNVHGVLTNGINSYFGHNLSAFGRPVLFSTVEEIPRTGDIAIALHAVGVGKSIAEALLIQASRSLLSDIGFPEHVVRINSLGDRESVNRYTRELTIYLRKRIEELPLSARELLKEHAYHALVDLIEHEHELSYRIPSPLEYLSDQSRRHFREIVEYLETANAAYEIDGRLMRHPQCYSEALFSIEVNDEHRPVSVSGGRYDEFVRRLLKLNVPATGAVVTLHSRRAPSRVPKPERGPDPAVFIVQLGFGPKIRSLLLLEDLKRARIEAVQAFASDSLSEQLRLAESLHVPFSLILGQKEFVEGTVIVRDMRNRSQESVPMPSLISHLKKVVRT